MKFPEIKFPTFKIPLWISVPVKVCGSIVGAYMVVETWVIKKAGTVVEPVKDQVVSMKERQDEFYRVVEDRMNQTDTKVNILIERSVQ